MDIRESLSEIEDFRIDRCKKHDLVDILMIVLIGFLCGHKDIDEIQYNAEISEKELKKYLRLENGIPSPDTILRVLAGIDSARLEEVFIQWTRETFGGQVEERDVLAIDGKTIRRARYKNNRAPHIVSAFASRLGVCFGQVKTEEKSNEITAIPRLLDLLDLKGVIVTIDAMGCQKGIARKISEKGADYLLSLKGNQEKIHEYVRDFFSQEMSDKVCQRHKIRRTEPRVEKDHGRVEKRQCFLCTDLGWLEERGEWANLKAVGMIKSEVWKDGETAAEARYFITSLTDEKAAENAARSHWGIENNLHWVLDTVYDEDYSRGRKDSTAQNLNVFRKMALNLLRSADFSPITTKKLSFAKKHIVCNKFPDFLFNVIQNI